MNKCVTVAGSAAVTPVKYKYDSTNLTGILLTAKLTNGPVVPPTSVVEHHFTKQADIYKVIYGKADIWRQTSHTHSNTSVDYPFLENVNFLLLALSLTCNSKSKSRDKNMLWMCECICIDISLYELVLEITGWIVIRRNTQQIISHNSARTIWKRMPSLFLYLCHICILLHISKYIYSYEFNGWCLERIRPCLEEEYKKNDIMICDFVLKVSPTCTIINWSCELINWSIWGPRK